MTLRAAEQERIPQQPPKGVVMTGISKRYGQVQALSDVDVSVAPGEVVGIVGDNGAGKSTLMKVLAGTISCDEGAISIDGKQYAFSNPNEAHAAGNNQQHP